MTNIKAFKGLHYNLDKIIDLSQVTCPPYDVINKEEQDFYYQQNPYNFIRLILNKEGPQDNDSHNKYTRADIFFKDWLKTGVLEQDVQDTIYFYKQDYFCEGKEFSRLGFVSLLGLSDDGIVFPHENTHAAPKMDRLELVKKVKANLSPIFTVFSDKHKIIKEIFDKDLSLRKPDFLLKDAEGIRNSVWRLTDEKKIKEISKKMQDSQIFIADGHHRYEVALMYRKLMRQQDKSYAPDKSYNYIMAYFTALESEGLYIMPIHRVIKSEFDLDSLRNIFKIIKLKSFTDLKEKLGKSSKKENAFGLYYKNDILLLELKDRKQVNAYFKDKKCFVGLDVAILGYLLSELLKIKKDDIIYTKEITEVKEWVDNNVGMAAFILLPTTIKQIKEVALCGEKMPPKSTYFYPKLLSGLVVHRFSA